MIDERGPGRLGIDAGASLWKLALVREEEWEMEMLPAGAVDEVQRRVRGWRLESVHVTGGGGLYTEKEKLSACPLWSGISNFSGSARAIGPTGSKPLKTRVLDSPVAPLRSKA